VADDDAARRCRRAQVPDELAQELVELVIVDSNGETPIAFLALVFGMPSPPGCGAVLQWHCNPAATKIAKKERAAGGGLI
jgi:hypothetical protein